MPRVLRLLSALPLMLALFCAATAWADPPGRVGRLSLLEGDVSLRPADSRHWEDATKNWPLTSGDALETGRGDRAEIRIGSSVVRLDGSTAIDIRQLDDERIRIVLERGSVALRVRSREPAAAIEIETRDGLVVADEPGQYRVDYDDATTTLTNYRGGEVEFRAEDSDVVVTEGRSAHIVYAERTDVRWDDPERDDFADWALARDARDDRLGRPRHVSPEMTGAEDLYEYGDWRESGDYGSVWYPRDVPAGWAPYRSGRWVSIDPWGWTWVDDMPWGFAPFHYGRWVLIGGAWAWVPGTYVARPIYAPALVVWIGTPGVSIGLSSGPLPDVGWFPLAPREVYVPYYRHSPTYVRQINITHVTNVVNITRIVEEPRRAHYIYRDRREAVTVVPGDVLRLSRPVQRDAMREVERRWQERQTVTPVPPIDPRLVAERNRRERATQPKDEDRLRDERLRRSERLREAVDQRLRREREGGQPPTTRALREAPERDPGRDQPAVRRLEEQESGPRRDDVPQRKQIPVAPQREQMLELQQRRQQQILQEQERTMRDRSRQEQANERREQRVLEQQHEERQQRDARARRQLIESQERERQQQDQTQQRQQRERERQQEREQLQQQQQQQQLLQQRDRQRQEQLERQQQRERERQQERAQQQSMQAQERERQQRQEQSQRQQRDRERQDARMQQLQQQQLQQQERARIEADRRSRAQPPEPRQAPAAVERSGPRGPLSDGDQGQGKGRRFDDEKRPDN